jgi:hypothetical protein
MIEKTDQCSYAFLLASRSQCAHFDFRADRRPQRTEAQMTHAMTEIESRIALFQTVDLETRIQEKASPAFASVNGYAQATVIRPAAQSASKRREKPASSFDGETGNV